MTERTCIINGSVYHVGDMLPANEFPMIEDAYRIEAPAPTRWYVVQTNPNCEARVEGGLMEANADVYLPRLTKWQKIPERHQKHRGLTREPVTRPLFPDMCSWVVARQRATVLVLRRVDGIRAVLRPGRFDRLTLAILELRGAEIAGALNQCVMSSRKKKGIASIGTIPQFVRMSESERIGELIRRVKGVEAVA